LIIPASLSTKLLVIRLQDDAKPTGHNALFIIGPSARPQGRLEVGTIPSPRLDSLWIVVASSESRATAACQHPQNPPTASKKSSGTSRPQEKLFVIYEELAEFPEHAVNSLVYWSKPSGIESKRGDPDPMVGQ
jgi:hypothetical protein